MRNQATHTQLIIWYSYHSVYRSPEVSKFLAEVNDFSGKEGHEMFLKGSLHKIATHFSPISHIPNLVHHLFTVFNFIEDAQTKQNVSTSFSSVNFT